MVYNSTMKQYVPITRHTKAGRAGKLVRCPTCNTIVRRVYHLSWSRLMCLVCKKAVNKYDLLIEETLYR